MDTDSTTTACFAAVRALEIGACLLAFGLVAFDRLIVGDSLQEGERQLNRGWRRFAGAGMLGALAVALCAGGAWFLFVASAMSGQPLRELTPKIIRLVWAKTRFGVLWQWRLGGWAVACAGGLVTQFANDRRVVGKMARGCSFLATAMLLGSLAWAGHGRTGSTGSLHLLTDAAHLLVSGFWPAGLLPFAVLLAKLQRIEPERRMNLAAVVTRRFSAMSLICAGLLGATGLMNSWYLAGPIMTVLDRPYGRLLAMKSVLFWVMVALGAVNLFRLKPRLLRECGAAQADPALLPRTMVRLRRNVIIELVLAVGVVLIVGLLGLLPPGHR